MHYIFIIKSYTEYKHKKKQIKEIKEITSSMQHSQQYC